MDWNRIESDWKQFISRAREQWSRITEDELDLIGGRRDTLAGQIREVYGISKEEAEKQLAEWQKGLVDVGLAADVTVVPNAK